MIVTDNGRTRSVRTDDEEVEMLARDLRRLTPEEREYVIALMADQKALEEMMYLDYERIPASPAEWLSDRYLSGDAGSSLYQVLKDEFIDFHTGGFFELFLTGSLGYGKSFLTTICLAYDVYRMSCLRSPQRTFGLNPTSAIFGFVISTSIYQGSEGLGSEFQGMIGGMPYFRDMFPFKASRTMIRFPSKNMHITTSSEGANKIIGLNTIFGAMDEANFYAKTKGHSPAIIAGAPAEDRASALYTSVIRRIKSRAQRRGAVLTHMYLLSSKTDSSSFMAGRIRECEKDPTVKVVDYATYDVKPRSKFLPTTFDVFAGSDYIQPRVLNPGEADTFPKDLQHRILRGIPDDFASDFKNDIYGALMDIAGVELAIGGRYIRLREKIEKFQDKTRRHPFTVESWTCGDPNGKVLWHLIADESKERIPGGLTRPKWTPKLNPNAMRFAHIDLSKTDLPTGLVIGHLDRVIEVTRRESGGTEYTEHLAVVVIDLMLQILPPLGGEIDPAQIRALLYEFRSHGFNVTNATADTFQSGEMLLRLNEKGITASILSLESDRRPYETLKRALYDERVRGYPYAPVARELRGIEQDPKTHKIIRPMKFEDGTRGTKDVADCLAGVVFGIDTSDLEIPTPPPPQESSRGSMDADDLWVLGDNTVPTGWKGS